MVLALFFHGNEMIDLLLPPESNFVWGVQKSRRNQHILLTRFLTSIPVTTWNDWS